MFKTVFARSIPFRQLSSWLRSGVLCEFPNHVVNVTLQERNFHAFSQESSLSHRHFIHKLTLNKQPVSLLSGHFIKLSDPPSGDGGGVLERDPRYELKRNQNFGPVRAEDSTIPNGHYALTSWEYSKRSHLTYAGVPYHELPIAFVRAKYNNTFIDVMTHDGAKRFSHVTCGLVGFKNAKKKSDHAAESVGKEAAERAVLLGCHEYVRVKLKGPGYGRAAALQGLVAGGLNIASVTDITPLHVRGLPQRPRKVRRV